MREPQEPSNPGTEEPRNPGTQEPRNPGTQEPRNLLPLNPNDHRGSAVQAPRLFTRVVVLRPFLAVADRAEPIRADAAARQVVADRVRAALAERQVVLGRADVARVPFDLDA